MANEIKITYLDGKVGVLKNAEIMEYLNDSLVIKQKVLLTNDGEILGNKNLALGRISVDKVELRKIQLFYKYLDKIEYINSRGEIEILEEF